MHQPQPTLPPPNKFAIKALGAHRETIERNRQKNVVKQNVTPYALTSEQTFFNSIMNVRSFQKGATLVKALTSASAPAPKRGTPLGRPKKAENRDTRQAILLAALDLFSLHGYSATSVRQIAREVGVRESALYVHFKGKAEILETLFEVYGPGPAALRLRKSDMRIFLNDPKTFLLEFMHEELNRWVLPEERKFLRIVVMENLCCATTSESAIGLDNMQRPRKAFMEMFELLIKEKTIKPINIELLMYQLMGPLLLLRHEHMLMGQGPVDMKKMRKFLKDHIEFIFSRLLIEK